jgi:NAD(P)-dependent dehydrogenase (short-subunit alcohol dehydrogenase family)
VAITIDLSGTIALVTGATRGVGLGIATRLLDAGAEVLVCGRRAPETLPADRDGREAVFMACDVRDPEAVARLVTVIVEELGRLDLCVNNAGGSPATETTTASASFSEKILALNLGSALELARAANAVMQTQESGGSIVNIASLSGMRPTPRTAAYGAAKAGLLNLTSTLAMEWAPKVRVNAVSPGIVRTEGFEAYYGGPEGAAAVSKSVPMGRVAEPADVGDAVVFLASGLAKFVSGTNLVVHGGGERLALTEWLGGV